MCFTVILQDVVDVNYYLLAFVFQNIFFEYITRGVRALPKWFSIDPGKPVDGGRLSTYSGPRTKVIVITTKREWQESNALQTFGTKHQLYACLAGLVGSPTAGGLLCRQQVGDAGKVADGGRQHHVYDSRCSSSSIVLKCLGGIVGGLGISQNS